MCWLSEVHTSLLFILPPVAWMLSLPDVTHSHWLACMQAAVHVCNLQRPVLHAGAGSKVQQPLLNPAWIMWVCGEQDTALHVTRTGWWRLPRAEILSCWWTTYAGGQLMLNGPFMLVDHSAGGPLVLVAHSCQEMPLAWAGHMEHCTLVSRQAPPVWESASESPSRCF